ncbi:MAG TPA: DUF222 domain-containing protein, partial [Geodermatophilus sp.]|nr:DUF222 domain-containing protein [Geodermatophilus sp.]
WFALQGDPEGADGRPSLRVHLDEPRQVSLTRYRAQDLAAATHAEELVPRGEVVVHVDAAVIADDAAAGRAHLEGGPPLHATQVRRMLCEATVVTMLSRGGEPLAVGRARRLATRAQRRALLRRDGGCARPGCPETRVERLHAHHLRHWSAGGTTDLANLVLLCDADHGLAHDLHLVMTRPAGELVAVTPEGRRVWGRPDVAFSSGPSPAATPAVALALLTDPDADLPGSLAAGGERMDLGYVVGVLLGNRDLERRLTAGRSRPHGEAA